MVHELVFLRLPAGMQILAEVEMLEENMELLNVKDEF